MRIALLAPLLAGCQLVVGEIELPTLITQDGDVADAWPADAAPPDAAVMDAQVVDMAWGDAAIDLDVGHPVDQAVIDMAPPDMLIDALPPDMYVPTPTDLTNLAGTWHLYGVRGRQQALSVFSAALRIDAEGAATLTEIGSDEALSEVPTLFDPHPDGTARVSINLFPRAGRLAGMMDPVGGVAVFINDVEFADTTPTVVIGTRINAINLLPERSLLVNLVGEPGPNAIQGGLLERSDMGATYRLIDRVRVEGGMQSAPADIAMDAQFTRQSRLRLTGEAAEDNYVLSPAAGGNGAVGLAGEDADAPNVVMAWHGSTGLFAPARFWCAGNALDGDGNHRTLSAYAVLEADGHLTFDTGAVGFLTHDGGDAFRIEGAPNFFGDDNVIATIDPDQRAMMLIDTGPAFLRWGLGVCVNIEPPIQ